MVTSPLASTYLPPLSPFVTNLSDPLPPLPGDVIFERPLINFVFRLGRIQLLVMSIRNRKKRKLSRTLLKMATSITMVYRRKLER